MRRHLAKLPRQDFSTVRIERPLEGENENIENDEKSIDKRRAVARLVVFDRKHAGFVSVIARPITKLPNLCMNGVIIIDKPAGLTSHDVVNRVRRILGQRSVGHLGTLDPLATGVL